MVVDKIMLHVLRVLSTKTRLQFNHKPISIDFTHMEISQLFIITAYLNFKYCQMQQHLEYVLGLVEIEWLRRIKITKIIGLHAVA